MKKLLIITFLFSHFSSFSFDDGSDKIIKKYLKAIGGAKEWEAVKTLQIVRHINETAFDVIGKISIIRDKGYRIEKHKGSGSPSIRGYYNDKGWIVINRAVIEGFEKGGDSTVYKSVYSNELKKIDDVDDNKNQHYLKNHFFKWQTQMPWCFIDFEKNGYQAIYKGDSKISVDDVLEIEMISFAGDTARYFFDKRTSFLLKAIHKNMELNFSNYKQIEKVKMPFGITETETDFKYPNLDYITPITQHFIVLSVKLNEPMDEKIFMKPKQ